MTDKVPEMSIKGLFSYVSKGMNNANCELVIKLYMIFCEILYID